MSQVLPIPPVLDSARALEYAVLNGSVSYSGHSSLFVNQKEIGPVPCLAICQVKNETGVLLFHCSENWTVLGAAKYSSLTEARERAERIYPGVSAHWSKAPFTEEEAEHFLEESWGDQQCDACLKKPSEIVRLIAKDNLRLCDSCIKQFYQMLDEEP